MGSTTTEIEKRLRHFAGQARALFADLAELLETLPAAPEEISAEDLEEDLAAPTEARSRVLCVLNDLLRPVVTSLLVAAGATPEEAAAQVPALPALPVLPGVAAASGPLPRTLEVQIERADWLPIPPAVAERLNLMNGDLLVLEKGPASVRLEPMRELLRDFLAWPEGEQQRFIRGFEDRASMYLPGAALVRPELFPLAPGDTVVLQIEDQGPGHRLYFFKEDSGERPQREGEAASAGREARGQARQGRRRPSRSAAGPGGRREERR